MDGRRYSEYPSNIPYISSPRPQANTHAILQSPHPALLEPTSFVAFSGEAGEANEGGTLHLPSSPVLETYIFLLC